MCFDYTCFAPRGRGFCKQPTIHPDAARLKNSPDGKTRRGVLVYGLPPVRCQRSETGARRRALMASGGRTARKMGRGTKTPKRAPPRVRISDSSSA